ncbi:hypothetical protein OS493_035896 [Desmophyllum pertusum]|uniref:Uncharacterized protein n=1 Tax=Desmophyllum pertusum TaxID=174260 RepID=A0A9W9Z7C9_9CNID|nr:hypothetical protein OS493_035896 [Desmophyllum pertusum]
MYRYGSIEGGMRSSKDSGFIEHDNASQHSNESETYTEANLGKVLHLSQSTEEFRMELNENEEEALKEELLHIFERERSSLEMYFKKKMEELLRGFRGRQMEWDEASRAEKAELEKNLSMEKMEMQKNFAEEIAKLTQSFNEERQQLEEYYQEQLKDLREKLGTEQKQTGEKFAKEKIELKEKLEAEYQVMLRREVSHEKQEAMREKSEMEARFNKEKLEIERNFNLRLTEVENNLQKVTAEFETNLTQERMRIEKECQEKIRQFEERLQEERLLRLDVEKELEREKAKYFNGESSNKKEHERLRNEVDVLRLEIQEKNRINIEMKSFEETVTLRGRDGLNGKLKDDFEKLLADHKMELDKTYYREKEALDQTVQAERRQLKEENDREKDKIKSEKDEIVRTREGLRVAEQAHVDRRPQQRGDSERVRPSLENHRIEQPQHQPPPPTPPLQQRQQPNKDSVWTGASSDSYVVQHDVTGSHQQLVNHSDYHLKNDPMWQPHYHVNVEHHERQQLPSNKPGTGLIKQSEPRVNSLYHVPSENEFALRFEMNAMKSENEGLKAKVTAMEENIDLHKKYKEEAKAEMERLLKANQDNDLKIQTLTSHVEELGKKDSEKVKVKRGENEDHTHEDRASTVEKSDEHLEGKLRGLEARAVKAEKTTKEYDVKTRLPDERRREKRRQDSIDSDHEIRGQRSATRQKDKSRYESVATNDGQDSSYKAKYEAMFREKSKLLQATKEMHMKIKTLEEKQAEILHHTSHLEKSSEKSGETERLKRLVSENSSLKERTSELQNQLQRLLEKLKNEKEKAASFETEISTRPSTEIEMSTHLSTDKEITTRPSNNQSSSLHSIQGLQERLIHTGRELSGSRGDLDPDALGRIEREIFSISQVIKTQFGEGSRGDLSHRSMTEETARVAQLEVEKKELEIKLKLAGEAMNEYVTRLNDKMQDVKSMTGMSEEMVQELHTRNNSLKKSLQALEEGQQTSHLQNEQLRHQKSVLQNLIGDLCKHEEPGDLGGTSYNASSKYLESKHASKYDRSHDNEDLGGTSYNSSSKYLDSKHRSKYARGHDNEELSDTSYNASSKYLDSKHRSRGHENEELSGTSYNVSSRYLDSKHRSRSHENEELSGTSYNASSKHLDSKHRSRGHENEELSDTSYNASSRVPGPKCECKCAGSYDNRYEDVDTNMEDRYLSKDFRKIDDGEKFSRGSKGGEFSYVYEEYPSGYSKFDHREFERISASHC